MAERYMDISRAFHSFSALLKVVMSNTIFLNFCQKQRENIFHYEFLCQSLTTAASLSVIVLSKSRLCHSAIWQ